MLRYMDVNLFLNNLQKIFSFKGYGVSEEEIKKRVIDSTYIFHQGITVLLMVLETYMLFNSVVRYGADVSGVHLYRRYLYALLDGFAILMTVILIFFV